ncbi:hypothetical protein PMG11_10979 [Penicillium brasilianum]|uniref:NB-ARC domain-containing protein n=1 Tax=Penicillium brasilianum TaxID=104259 RepID=A0A0F7U532_PENBI|nr:hypothetical protein PMG11_10979 [Penicillium brasilianum]
MLERAKAGRKATSSSCFTGSNSGLQIGHNYGETNAHFHLPLAPEERPQPLAMIPFGRDPDFVDPGSLIDRVHELSSKPSARLALVGFGGVGKSQIAIEYTYWIRERLPKAWVFWVHASDVVRYEEGLRDIAERVKIPRRHNPTANIFQLVGSKLHCKALPSDFYITVSSNVPRKQRSKNESFEASNKVETPQAMNLLSLMSFFDRQGIPDYLLRASFQDDDHDETMSDIDEGYTPFGPAYQKEESIENALADPDGSIAGMASFNLSQLDFEDSIATLQDYSFISTNPETLAFEMHGLVQLSIQEWLSTQGRLEHWKEIFIRNLSGISEIHQL